MVLDVSKENCVGYPKDMFRQDIPIRRIAMGRRSMKDWMKTWQPPADANPGNRTSLTDKDDNHKISGVLCKLLQQQAAPERNIYCFDGNTL